MWDGSFELPHPISMIFLLKGSLVVIYIFVGLQDVCIGGISRCSFLDLIIPHHKYAYVAAKVYRRLMYTLAPNFEANVYISPKLQTSRLMCTLAPNFEANVYIRPKLQTWRLK